MGLSLLHWRVVRQAGQVLEVHSAQGPEVETLREDLEGAGRTDMALVLGVLDSGAEIEI